ncbi:MAG: ThiF family adenylyltransferase [Planctomycetes bacterium]|nr:ThiF family adenylyltransferase [Planctomycetota bacterium]
MRVPAVGPAGQERLAQARATLIGLGALGSVTADLLARAGVGTLRLIDRDVVEWSNLQRQTLYDEADATATRTKVEASIKRLRAINSEIRLEPRPFDLTATNHRELLADSTVLVDGTDNFATRYLLNDFAVITETPFIYAGVVSTYGMVGSILPPHGPCLRCTYPEPPASQETPTCRSAGVIGPAVSVIAGLAATRALQVIVESDEIQGNFQYIDVWSGEHSSLRAPQDPDCPCCQVRDFAWAEARRGTRAAEPLCGGGAVHVPPSEQPPDLHATASRLAGSVEALERGPSFLRFRSGELEVYLFADRRALVRGTEDPGRARALLSETVGS